jgi:hypothetical protein
VQPYLYEGYVLSGLNPVSVSRGADVHVIENPTKSTLAMVRQLRINQTVRMLETATQEIHEASQALKRPLRACLPSSGPPMESSISSSTSGRSLRRLAPLSPGYRANPHADQCSYAPEKRSCGYLRRRSASVSSRCQNNANRPARLLAEDEPFP